MMRLISKRKGVNFIHNLELGAGYLILDARYWPNLGQDLVPICFLEENALIGKDLVPISGLEGHSFYREILNTNSQFRITNTLYLLRHSWSQTRVVS